MTLTISNETLAYQLRQHASQLAENGANLYRVRAFRQAALAILGLQEPATELVRQQGESALARIPGIGDSLAETIAHWLQTGRWAPRTPTRSRSAPIRYGLKVA